MRLSCKLIAMAAVAALFLLQTPLAFGWGNQHHNPPTPAPTNTNSPTNTFTPTNTNTFTPTNTNAPSNTNSFTPTNTNAPSNTNSFTPTNTNSPTNTFTPTNTNSPTNTFTPTNTVNPVVTSTSSSSSTASSQSSSSSTSGSQSGVDFNSSIDNNNNVKTGDQHVTANPSATVDNVRGGQSSLKYKSRSTVYAASAYAPPVFAGAAGECTVGTSLGINALFVGVSGGHSYINKECLDLKAFFQRFQTVCTVSDNHAQVALQSMELALQAGREESSNFMASRVGAAALGMANAKARNSLQLDEICQIMSRIGNPLLEEELRTSGVLAEPVVIPTGNDDIDEKLLQMKEEVTREFNDKLNTAVEKTMRK